MCDKNWWRAGRPCILCAKLAHLRTPLDFVEQKIRASDPSHDKHSGAGPRRVGCAACQPAWHAMTAGIDSSQQIRVGSRSALNLYDPGEAGEQFRGRGLGWQAAGAWFAA